MWRLHGSQVATTSLPSATTHKARGSLAVEATMRSDGGKKTEEDVASNLMLTIAAEERDEVADGEGEGSGEMQLSTTMELRRSSNDESGRTG